MTGLLISFDVAKSCSKWDLNADENSLGVKPCGKETRNEINSVWVEGRLSKIRFISILRQNSREFHAFFQSVRRTKTSTKKKPQNVWNLIAVLHSWWVHWSYTAHTHTHTHLKEERRCNSECGSPSIQTVLPLSVLPIWALVSQPYGAGVYCTETESRGRRGHQSHFNDSSSILFSRRSAACRFCLWIMRSSTSAEETGWSWDPRSGSAYPTAHGRIWRSTADVVSPVWSEARPLFLFFNPLLHTALILITNFPFSRQHLCIIFSSNVRSD